MKTVIAISLYLLCVNAFALDSSCPDVSGKFENIYGCASTECGEARPTSMRIEIKQKSCGEVELDLWGVPIETYIIGVPKEKVYEGGSIRTALYYFNESLIITEAFGKDLSRPYKNVVTKVSKANENGQTYLYFEDEVLGGRCTIKTTCKLSPK